MVESIAFWYLPDDEDELLQFIDKDNRAVVVPLKSAVPISEELVCSPSQMIAKENPTRMCLILKPHLSQVRYVKYEEDGETLFGIDAVNSPVISFRRSLFRERDKLGRGSVSAHLEKLVTDKKALIAKPDDFISWTKSVMLHIKKMTPKWHQYKSYRLTERVAEAMKNGLELVP
jgi:hypothetical protein